MTLPFLRNIRARLALLLLLAMAALVVLLVYQQIQQRSETRRRAEVNLERLGTFAANAERERFEATRRLFEIITAAESLRNVAATPDDQTAFDACTRGLYILDQLLVPGTRSTLYDTSGNVLCSSRAAARGAFNASDKLWFRTAVERGAFSTGSFEAHPQTGEPGLTFGIPITDQSKQNIVAYLSAQLDVSNTNSAILGENLPRTGILTVVDQDGVVINSTAESRQSGDVLPWFKPRFGSLANFLDKDTSQFEGRTRSVVRITDNDDAGVFIIVSAENDVLVGPLVSDLTEELLPVAVVTLLSLVAVWILAQRWVARPVQALVTASDALASGQLGARADVPSGISEFEKLGNAFNEMAETRERASHAKDEFLGLVSHELKTPITTVLGNAEILRTRGDRVPADLRQTALDDIHDSAIRLTSIIDNLLALARLDRGAALETEPLPLLRIAQAFVDELARIVPARRIEVRGDHALLGLGGETYVEQVTRNLVSNAIKYSPSDEIVEVLVEQRGDMVALRVLDRGSGIDDGERSAIFEPFYRSANTSAVAEGMGIGLSVCKRLIEAMGGEIWCKDREGGGTEFGYTLPLVTDDVPAAEEPTRESSAEESLSPATV